MSGLGNKEIFSNNLRTLMERFGKDRAQICADLNFKYTTFTDWYKGNKYPRIDKIEMLATYFGVLKSDLIEDKGGVFSIDTVHSAAVDNVTPIRFLGSVAAGYNHLANEEYEYMNIPTDWMGGRKTDDFFIMRVSGSSMYPKYCDGDNILCLACSDIGCSGRIGVIVYGDSEATLKKIVYEPGGDWIDLVPINPEYETKRIQGVDLEQCRIIGRAIKLIRDIDTV